MSRAIVAAGLIGILGGCGLAQTTNGGVGFFLGVAIFAVLAILFDSRKSS